jgi:hypothetical protein
MRYMLHETADEEFVSLSVDLLNGVNGYRVARSADSYVIDVEIEDTSDYNVVLVLVTKKRTYRYEDMEAHPGGGAELKLVDGKIEKKNTVLNYL